MNKLHRYARHIVKSIDRNLSVVQSDDGENSFDFSQNLVTLDLRPSETFGFMRHLYFKHNNKFILSEKLWTILHEIGHYRTQDLLTDEEYEESQFDKMVCQFIPLETARNNTKAQDMYFDALDEWLATEWAIKYVSKHYKKCVKWSRKLELLA